MKIVILDGHALNPGDMRWDCFSQFGEIRYFDYSDTEAEVIAHIADAEIVLLNKPQITRTVLDACPGIRLLCVLATGYNVVDCVATAEKGIPVCNVPGYSTDSVAQFTFALLLELCHQIGHHSRVVHEGKWSNCPDFCFWDTPQMELAGKTLGILGYGSIGHRVGQIAAAFGMQVIAHSRTVRPETSTKYVSLDELLSQSDVLSLHCPLFPETREIINAEAIAKMKDGAILLNTARGALVDEVAVAEALKSGKLQGAAMDVVSAEPIHQENPLLTAPNCILTPHMAWAPIEARQRILDITVENIHSFLSGKPVNVVNL